MKFEIRNRWSGTVQYSCELSAEMAGKSYGLQLGFAVKSAIASDSNLSGSNLRGSDLRGSNLRDSDLSGSDLRGSNLRDSDLSGSDLRGSNLRDSDLSGSDLRGSNLRDSDLSGSDLRGSNLRDSNLSGSNLRGSDLRGSNLRDSNLSGSNLRGSDLRGSNLRDSDLSGSDLRGSNLRDAKNAELAIAKTRILPDGDLIVWKRCRHSVIVKLRIPAAAKRCHAFGRKCRAEYADVLEVLNGDKGISTHDGKTEYVVGARILPDAFDTDWTNECSNGVHFFITREEAEDYT